MGIGKEKMAAVALITACVIWGASFMFGKVAIAELHPANVVLLRSLLASLVLLPFALRSKVNISPVDIPRFLVVGFLTIPATFLLQYVGLALTTATSATLIVGALPPMLALGTSLFTGERLSGKVWTAVAASSMGVFLVVGEPGAGRSFVGDGLVLLSLVVCVVWMLMSKDLLDKYPVVVMTAYVHAIGTIFLAPIAILWAGVPRLDLSSAAWVSVAVLGLGCSALTYALWNWAVKQVPVARAGLVVNIEPLVGVALGALVLGEPVGSHAYAGGALILGSAFLAGSR